MSRGVLYDVSPQERCMVLLGCGRCKRIHTKVQDVGGRQAHAVVVGVGAGVGVGVVAVQVGAQQESCNGLQAKGDTEIGVIPCAWADGRRWPWCCCCWW